MTGRDEQERGPGGASRDHAAVLRIAWAELRERPFREAIARIRDALPPGADHATRTLCWARLVAAAIGRGGARTDFESFLTAHPELGDPERVLVHYSPERLASPRARREFVLPDREPLPRLSLRGARLVVEAQGEGTKTVSSS